jgi:hypothetical protein
MWLSWLQGSDSFFVANISATTDYSIVLDPLTDDLVTYSKAPDAINAVGCAHVLHLSRSSQLVAWFVAVVVAADRR